MSIKSVKREGEPPDKVQIAYNASGRFLAEVVDVLKKDWGVRIIEPVENKLMAENTMIIYDRYDQVLVVEIKGQIFYKKLTKAERDAAMVRVSASG